MNYKYIQLCIYNQTSNNVQALPINYIMIKNFKNFQKKIYTCLLEIATTFAEAVQTAFRKI